MIETIHSRKYLFLGICFNLFLFFCLSCSSSNEADNNEKSLYDSTQQSITENTEAAEETYNEQTNQINPNESWERNYPPTDLDQVSAKIEDLLDELESSVETDSTKILSIDSILEKIGTENPEELFVWVRDNTYFVPYQGVLRGDKGVLMDKLGNSLDRSILLYETLIEAGFETRLAHVRLSIEQAEDIIKHKEPFPRDLFSPIESHLTESDRELIDECSAKYGVDKEYLLEAVKKKELDNIQNRDRLKSMVDREFNQISKWIRKLRTKPNSASHNTIYKSIQDHWWVQYLDESEWKDLDLTLPDANPGDAIAEPSETFQLEELEEDLYFNITFKIVIEQWKDNRLKEHEILSYTFKPMDVLGKRITLHHIPADWPEQWNVFSEEDPESSLREKILEQKNWLPLLQIDEDEITSLGFDIYGDPQKELKKKKKRTRSPAGIAGGFQRALSGGGSESDEEKNSFLTAEWIEYEIYAPNQPSKNIRRQLFDLIGSAARLDDEISEPGIDETSEIQRNLVLLGATEILPLCCHLSDQFIQNFANTQFLVNRESLLSLFQVDIQQETQELIEKVSSFKPFPTPMYLLALYRPHPENYIDFPNIFTIHSYFVDGQAGSIDAINALDIVENKVAVFADKGENAFQIRLRQGIYDSMAESFFLAPYGVDYLTLFFEEMKKQGVGWKALEASEDSFFENSKIPSDLLAQMQRDLSQGNVVLAPEREILVNGRPVYQWWRINPERGDTLLIGEFGWGQAYIETIEKIELLLDIKGMFELIGDILKCAFHGAIIALADKPLEQTVTFLKCVEEVICNQFFKEVEKYADLETSWTHFILKQTFGWLAGQFCKMILEDL
ncbi:MAG: hypothetical protein WBF32_01865 [Candidatus Aminicenantaceae bacterium]